MKNQNFKISHAIQKTFSIAYSEVDYFVCSCIVCVADVTEGEERGESDARAKRESAKKVQGRGKKEEN